MFYNMPNWMRDLNENLTNNDGAETKNRKTGNKRTFGPGGYGNDFFAEPFNNNIGEALDELIKLGSKQLRQINPRVNIYSTKKEYVIEAAVPGYSKEDIELEFTDSTISIKSNISNDSSDTSKNILLKEVSKSSFNRSFNLPEGLDCSKISAKLELGILMVTIPYISRDNGRTPPTRVEIG